MAITAASPTQLAAELQALVSALQDEQALKNGQANSLIVKLNLQDNAGDVGKVEAFLNEVAALRRSGRLTQEQSQVLLDEGNLLLLSLTQ